MGRQANVIISITMLAMVPVWTQQVRGVRYGNAATQYHPRQWVDGSSPTYKKSDTDSIANPTNGSWWIVQVQPSS